MKRFYGNRSLCRSVPRQRGFSLVEVMVALAILSVGALGMAGLQTVTVRINNTALVESQAATLAQDLMERVRANPDGDYSSTFETTASTLTSCSGTNSNCNTTAMANYDLMAWQCALGTASSVCGASGIEGQLPNGAGSVTVAGNIYTISIRWFDAASNANQTIVITSVL